jgi:hypothetical protein
VVVVMVVMIVVNEDEIEDGDFLRAVASFYPLNWPKGFPP